uniref:Uncharacterized protein n=1 Tax=viral metagenome TaxID=1070528 RepID=A0A6M3IX45_9ZZZZ
MPRTEEDKIVQSPVKVILGGREYEIKPLPIKYSLPWVKKVAGILVNILPMANIASDDEAFSGAFNEIMVSRPEELVGLFFEYARDLNKAEIEETASSAEIVNAFEEVLSLERPLFGMTLRVIAKAMPQGSAVSLKSYSSNGTSPQTKL